jgi:hypothetical protein
VAVARATVPLGQDAARAAAARDLPTLRTRADEIHQLIGPVLTGHPADTWAGGPGEFLGVAIEGLAGGEDVAANQLVRAYSATPIDEAAAREALGLLDDVPQELAEIDRLLTTVAPLGVHC